MGRVSTHDENPHNWRFDQLMLPLSPLKLVLSCSSEGEKIRVVVLVLF